MCVFVWFHDNQEQYAKCECFSDLMSVRTEKARAKQVDLCVKSVYYHTEFMVYPRGQMNEN